MLQLSHEQVWDLRDQRTAAFEESLVRHARKHLATRCAHLDDATLRSAARRIVEDARAAGLRSQVGIALYFNVAVCFGMDFLKNPGIRWVLPIQPAPDEELDPLWIVRVGEIASLTLKEYERQGWRA